VNITVAAVNDAPVAVNDAFTTTEDTALGIPVATGVLANDTDVEGSALTAAVVAGPAHGTVTLNADGSLTYTPTANYSGPDSFTYHANDGSADSNTATVDIAVTAVNDAPVGVNDAFTIAEDTALVVSVATGVLANDTDAEGSALTAALATGPAHGTLTLNVDGSFTYTPASNFNGTDAFTYQASDGSASSAVVTVSITVTPVTDLIPATGTGTSQTVAWATAVTLAGALVMLGARRRNTRRV
jgi:VCBS repeat-containing protein